MTPIQKKLLKGIEELAEKEGLELETITVQVYPKSHKEVSDFIRLIDKAHEKAKHSKLKFDSYIESGYYALPDTCHAYFKYKN